MLEAVKTVTGKTYREIVSEEYRVNSEAFATAQKIEKYISKPNTRTYQYKN